MPTRLSYRYLYRSSTLDGLAFDRRQELTLTGQGTPERIGGLLTARNLVIPLPLSTHDAAVR